MAENKELALAWLAGNLSRESGDDVTATHGVVTDRFLSIGHCERCALACAILAGTILPGTTLENIKHGAMTDIYVTPFGTVMLDQG